MVVKLVITLVCHTRGRGFKSRPSRVFKILRSVNMLECKKIDVDISKLPVSLSEKAVQIIEKALKSKDWDRKALRISVEGGGCQGFKYGLNLTQDFDDNDVFCQYSRSITIFIDLEY